MQSPAYTANPRLFLSVLWTFFLMNIIFRDIHQFLSPGYMEWVIAGEMFGMKITNQLLLFGGIAVMPMISMIMLPHLLSRPALRISNMIAAIWTAALILFTPPIDPDDVFFLIICIATLAFALWYGWTQFSPATKVPATE